MNRSIVLRKNTNLGIPNEFLEGWEQVGNRLGFVKSMKKVVGILKLRQILALSNEQMRVLLQGITGKWYDESTLSHWERAERYRSKHKKLPKGYWKYKAAPRYVVEACHRFITALVLKISQGRYIARVRNVRVPWRVELWRMA